MRTKRYGWWPGVAFYAGVQAVAWGLRFTARKLQKRPSGVAPRDDREIYRAERLPVFAPPGSAFPIAWSINSVSAIAGGLHVLNLPGETEGRAEFLRLQAAAWCIFALFPAGFFELRSPINAAIITFAYSGVAVASLAVAVGRMRDRRAAWSLATTVAWLALANPVAVTQAAWNRDPFWRVGPSLAPPAGWEKQVR